MSLSPLQSWILIVLIGVEIWTILKIVNVLIREDLEKLDE